MNFSMIIPNLNGAKFLVNCLPSLITSLKPLLKNHPFEIILVDNASTDDSISLFKKIFNSSEIRNFKFEIIQNNFNHGFAPSINQGISKSSYEWVVLLNNDIVISPDWFTKIIAQIKLNKDKYAVYCGTILTADGAKYESSGLNFNYKGKCQNINNGLPFLANAPTRQRTSLPIWGSSAALVIYNKKILNTIGGFDNDFFAYEEDVDVALRLQLLNHKTLLVPNAISYHFGGGTSSKMGNFRQIMDTKNWFYIIIKDYPMSIILKYLPQIFVERLRNLSGLIKSTPIHQLPQSLIKSYGQVLIYLPQMLYKRHKFQKLSSLPPGRA